MSVFHSIAALCFSLLLLAAVGCESEPVTLEEQAEAAQEELSETREEATEILSDAEEEAVETMAEAREDAKSEIASAEREAEKMVDDAQQNLEQKLQQLGNSETLDQPEPGEATESADKPDDQGVEIEVDDVESVEVTPEASNS